MRLTDRRALLIIAGAVLLANGLYVLGIFDANPLGPVSRLLSSETAGVLNGVPVLDKDIGYTSQALGHLAAEDWLHFQLPWWNPYEATGAPLAAEMQSAAFFPPTILLAAGGGQLWEHMLLELIAGCSTYLLLRRLDISMWASTLAGVAFALNGTFAWFGHAPVNPIAFLPLTLLGVEQAYDASRTGRHGGWWLIAVAGALSVYAGFPEVAYIDGLLVLGWVVWRARCAGRARLRPFALKVGAGGVAAGLLAAPLLLAFLRFLPDAYLAVHASGGEAGVHLPTQSLPQLVLPYVYGNPFQFTTTGPLSETLWSGTGGFVALSVALLALIGAVAPRRRGLRVLLIVWLVVALARTYGAPVITPLLNLIPGMKSTEFSRYGWPSIEFAAVVLAAFGLDHLVVVRPSRRRVVTVGAVALAAVVLIAVAALPTVSAFRGGFPRRSWAFAGAWAVVITSALAVAVALPRPRARLRLLSALMVVDLVTMFALAQFSAPRAVSLDLAPVNYLRAHLGTARFATVGPFRPDYGAYFGVASLNDIDVPLPKNWATFVTGRLDPDAKPNEFVGTGYRSDTAPTPTSAFVSHIDAYREAGVAYVLTFHRYTLPQVKGVTQVDLTPSARIYRVDGATPYFSTSSPDCRISPHGRSAVTVTCPKPALLVRHETFLRGWSASIDGRSSPVAASSIFQAVRIPAGTHRIDFSYAPPGIALAWVAFVLGVGWIVVAGTRSRSEASRRRTAPRLVMPGAPPARQLPEHTDSVRR